MAAEEGKRRNGDTPDVTRYPESAVGDAADGVAGNPLASSPEIKPEGDSPLPEAAPGGASAIERRERNIEWWGNERRLGRI